MPYPIQNRPADARESLYFPEIFRAIGLVVSTFWRNAFFSRDPNPDILERDRTRNRVTTLLYPEEKQVYPPGYRGLHRLVPRVDGKPRCVACYMCATACPAQCIYIEAAEVEGDPIEKYPKKFVIDELRCVVCGFCVEACPKDAIRMDTKQAVMVGGDRGLGVPKGGVGGSGNSGSVLAPLIGERPRPGRRHRERRPRPRAGVEAGGGRARRRR